MRYIDLYRGGFTLSVLQILLEISARFSDWEKGILYTLSCKQFTLISISFNWDPKLFEFCFHFFQSLIYMSEEHLISLFNWLFRCSICSNRFVSFRRGVFGTFSCKSLFSFPLFVTAVSLSTGWLFKCMMPVRSELWHCFAAFKYNFGCVWGIRGSTANSRAFTHWHIIVKNSYVSQFRYSRLMLCQLYIMEALRVKLLKYGILSICGWCNRRSSPI